MYDSKAEGWFDRHPSAFFIRKQKLWDKPLVMLRDKQDAKLFYKKIQEMQGFCRID